MKQASTSLISAPKVEAITPAQKAAIVLASLPRETAASIVSEIDDTHLASFIRAVSDMKSAPPQTRLSIALEFIAEVQRRREELPGGSAEAGRLLSEFADKARVERVMGAIASPKDRTDDLWRRAAALPVERLIAFLMEQRPPTAAAILSSLPATRSADILTAAPIEFSQGLTTALAQIGKPDEATAEAIANAIEAELIRVPAAPGAVLAVPEPVTDILDLLPSTLREGLIDHIETSDKSIADAIRKSLLTFQILPARLTEVAVAALVRAADRGVLLRALKQAETNAPATNEFLLANMSKRMAIELREELASLAAPPLSDGEGAQRAIVATVKALEKSGEIKLKPAT